MKPLPVLLITMGDPDGVGPEIIVKSFLKEKSLFDVCIPVVIGNIDIMKKASGIAPAGRLKLAGIDADAVLQPSTPGLYGLHGRRAMNVVHLPGRTGVEYVRTATRICIAGKGKIPLVTAPVSKEKITGSGIKFSGHTEYIAGLCDVKKIAMVMASSRHMVLLVTRHIPLGDVAGSISRKEITEQVKVVGSTVRDRFGKRLKKVIMCGLNPHLGEGGNSGREEKNVMTPAVRALKAMGFSVHGPVSCETAFLSPTGMAMRGTRTPRGTPARLQEAQIPPMETLIVCHYHDQAMVPLRILYQWNFVNLTCGLPFIRTSPGHGTAFDIAGKNIADCSGMASAIRLALAGKI
ncbi:MAG: 4-hydroxythreonine-4-phosphate dehydrogenase PdxA [Elusimicrobiota bacterium]